MANRKDVCKSWLQNYELAFNKEEAYLSIGFQGNQQGQQ
jgi:hypothetical protein